MSEKSGAKTVIIVIDSTFTRGQAMAKSFREAGCKVFHFYESDGQLFFWGKEQPKEVCLIKLWHFGDLEQDWPEVNATLNVYYGGHGGNDPRPKPKHIGDRIWRRVGTEEYVLTRPEAEELITYARGLLDKVQPPPTKPAFLSPPTQVQLLSTLAVICKGYLAVYAAADVMNNIDARINVRLPDTSEMKTALAGIGWLTLQEDKEALQNIVEGLSRHVSLVQSPGWWRRPFLVGEGSDFTPEQAEKFVKAVKAEWAEITGVVQSAALPQQPVTNLDKSFEDVNALLGVFTQGDATVAPDVVAKAYISLSKVVESKGRL